MRRGGVCRVPPSLTGGRERPSVPVDMAVTPWYPRVLSHPFSSVLGTFGVCNPSMHEKLDRTGAAS